MYKFMRCVKPVSPESAYVHTFIKESGQDWKPHQKSNVMGRMEAIELAETLKIKDKSAGQGE